MRASEFQSPMGISSALNLETILQDDLLEEFQSPMGISSALNPYESG